MYKIDENEFMKCNVTNEKYATLWFFYMYEQTQFCDCNSAIAKCTTSMHEHQHDTRMESVRAHEYVIKFIFRIHSDRCHKWKRKQNAEHYNYKLKKKNYLVFKSKFVHNRTPFPLPLLPIIKKKKKRKKRVLNWLIAKRKSIINDISVGKQMQIRV